MSSPGTLADMIDNANNLAIAAAPPSERQLRQREQSALLRAAYTKPVTFRPALFWHDDEQVIWPRTVNLIQGQTGVHKSRVAEVFGSAVLAQLAGRPNLSATLGVGFRPVEGEHYRLLYVDTERNLTDQFPFALQQLKTRAGYDLAQHPPGFDFASLVLESRAERFAALTEFLADQRRDFDGHLLVILDVLSDCVADYNDVGASLGLIDLLNVAVNEQDATFLAVIHENPGSTAKARGHLGTEASNKASTVLQVSLVKEQNRPTGLIQLLYLKRRYAAPGLTFFATFDEFSKGLVRADADAPEVQVRARPTGPPRKASATTVLAILPDLLASAPMSAGHLASAVASQLSIGNRTAREYLAELLEPGAGYVNDAQGRRCCLTRSRAQTGLSLLYSLKPA